MAVKKGNFFSVFVSSQALTMAEEQHNALVEEGQEIITWDCRLLIGSDLEESHIKNSWSRQSQNVAHQGHVGRRNLLFVGNAAFSSTFDILDVLVKCATGGFIIWLLPRSPTFVQLSVR